MSEEESPQLLTENAELKRQSVQHQQRLRQVEALLVSALPRSEEVERRLAKDSQHSSLPPSRDRGTRPLSFSLPGASPGSARLFVAAEPLLSYKGGKMRHQAPSMREMVAASSFKSIPACRMASSSKCETKPRAHSRATSEFSGPVMGTATAFTPARYSP